MPELQLCNDLVWQQTQNLLIENTYIKKITSTVHISFFATQLFIQPLKTCTMLHFTYMKNIINYITHTYNRRKHGGFYSKKT
jgi:hypothetical protein